MFFYNPPIIEVVDKTTNYTLNESDQKNVVVFNSRVPVTCTIPNGLQVGFSCTIIQRGIGTVTFATPQLNTDVNGASISTPTKGLWGWAKVLCIALGQYTIDFGGDASVFASSTIKLKSQYGTNFLLSVLEEDNGFGAGNGIGSLLIEKI